MSFGGVVDHKGADFLDVKNTAIKEREHAASRRWKELIIVMKQRWPLTISWLLMYVFTSCCTADPYFLPLCLFVVLVLKNLSGRSQMQASFFFFPCLECWNRKDCSCQTKPVSHREQQLPAVGNQWSFLQINSIQLSSTAHCRFLDVGFWKLDLSLWNTESLIVLLFWMRTFDPSFCAVARLWVPDH